MPARPDNRAVVHPTQELLMHVADLERRDERVAGEIARIVELEARVGTLRTRRSEVERTLLALPTLLTSEEDAERAARVVADDAAARASAAERRVAELERSRRKREDELDQSRRELHRSREERRDAEASVRRHAERRSGFLDDDRALRAEAEQLVLEARAVATEISATPRVPAVGIDASELEEWGGQARAALFVARGGLETERERLVDEANALGSAVLGEPLGASGVALVRRRIVERLGSVPGRTTDRR